MYLTRWGNFNRDLGGTFAAFDLMRRQMNELFRDFDRPSGSLGSGYADASWPRTNLYDTGSELVLYAAVPGMSADEIQISATGDVLSITGVRGVTAPEGYSVHRQERGNVTFSRSFTLPCKVDIEKTTADVKDGMLTILMAKAKESQPRQITVKASS